MIIHLLKCISAAQIYEFHIFTSYHQQYWEVIGNLPTSLQVIRKSLEILVMWQWKSHALGYSRKKSPLPPPPSPLWQMAFQKNLQEGVQSFGNPGRRGVNIKLCLWGLLLIAWFWEINKNLCKNVELIMEIMQKKCQIMQKFQQINKVTVEILCFSDVQDVPVHKQFCINVNPLVLPQKFSTL